MGCCFWGFRALIYSAGNSRFAVTVTVIISALRRKQRLLPWQWQQQLVLSLLLKVDLGLLRFWSACLVEVLLLRLRALGVEGFGYRIVFVIIGVWANTILWLPSGNIVLLA